MVGPDDDPVGVDHLPLQDLDLRRRGLELAAGTQRVHPDPDHGGEDDHQKQGDG